MGRMGSRGAVVALATGMFLAFAAPAWAHVEITPGSAAAGSRVTLGVQVPHGCGDSPTIKLSVKVPPGAGGAEAESGGGWTGSVEGDVVRWAARSVPTTRALSGSR